MEIVDSTTDGAQTAGQTVYGEAVADNIVSIVLQASGPEDPNHFVLHLNDTESPSDIYQIKAATQLSNPVEVDIVLPELVDEVHILSLEDLSSGHETINVESFHTPAPSAAHDVLGIRDVFTHEGWNGLTSENSLTTAEVLDDYLFIHEEPAGGPTETVNEIGTYSSGSTTEFTATEEIHLKGVSLEQLSGLSDGTQAEIIQGMLDNGTLDVD